MTKQITSSDLVDTSARQQNSWYALQSSAKSTDDKLLLSIGLHHLRDHLARAILRPESFFREVTESIQQIFAYPVVTLYALTNQRLLLRHCLGVIEGRPEELTLRDGIASQVVETDQTVFRPEIDNTHSAEIATPLYLHKKIVGVIGVASKGSHKLGPEDCRLIECIASYVAQALEQIERAEVQAKRAIELEAVAQMRDDFLAGMGHDLRNPLNAILTLTETLLEGVYGDQTPRQQRSLQSIEKSGKHLLAMLNDILDLSKIGAGKIQLEIQEFSVAEMIEGVLQLVAEAAFKKSITVTRQVDATILTVEADRRRLAQIIINLLNNAIKLVPTKGTIRLEVNGDPALNRISFGVWDNGPGISNEERQQLFRPFVELDGTFTPHDQGIGLGVALVRSLTELHGGSVTLESTSEQGNRFVVTIPWQQQKIAGQ